MQTQTNQTKKNKKMKIKTFPYYTILGLSLLFSSCVSSKKMLYFQPMEEGAPAKDKLVQFEPTLGVGDLLTINVSALDPVAAVAFNLVEQSGTTTRALPYLINAVGEVNFPVLGTLKVAGLTTQQLTDQLELKLAEYIVNPVVNIRLTNFKVTVLGEVKKPGTYTVANERISIVEALGLAGDLTIQGKRSNVLLIREQNGKRITVPIDLTSDALFSSPYYYLAQNDVLYIEPNKTKLNSSAVGANTSVIFSSISILVTILTLLTR